MVFQYLYCWCRGSCRFYCRCTLSLSRAHVHTHTNTHTHTYSDGRWCKIFLSVGTCTLRVPVVNVFAWRCFTMDNSACGAEEERPRKQQGSGRGGGKQWVLSRWRYSQHKFWNEQFMLRVPSSWLGIATQQKRSTVLLTLQVTARLLHSVQFLRGVKQFESSGVGYYRTLGRRVNLCQVTGKCDRCSSYFPCPLLKFCGNFRHRPFSLKILSCRFPRYLSH